MIDRTGSQIDHLNIAVPNPGKATAFYQPLLATPTDPAMTGYGWPDKKPFFWLINNGTVGTNMHLAFTAPNRAAVRDFYTAAQDLGAQLLHPPSRAPRIPPALLRRIHPRPPRNQPRSRLPPL